MKNIYFLKAAIIFNLYFFGITYAAAAQGIYQMWGTTIAGGKDDRGSFFSTRYDGTGLQNKAFFTRKNSGLPWEGNQPVAYNGKLYSILRYGGINDDGIISEFDPATDTYTTKANFYEMGTAPGVGSLVLAGNKFYGLTNDEGSGKPSTIFEFNPVNGVTTIRHEFVDATGDQLGHEPVLYDNKLYGLTRQGGNNGEGVIYEFDIATGTYTVRHHLDENFSGTDRTGFTVYNNKLWTVNGNGLLFSFDPATNIISGKKNISDIGATSLYGAMAVLNNKLYGVSSFGGPGDEGFIYEYNPASNVLALEKDFTASTVKNRFSLLSYNGLLYGSSIFGGANGNGELFSYDPVNNIYTSLETFNAHGAGRGRLTVASNRLYGWLNKGGLGVTGEGSLFEYDLANSQYSILLELGGTELLVPQGELMYHKNKLYGAATYGGALKAGGIYAFDLQTQTFEVKVPMSETNGRFSDQGGFLLYNEKLYGVTSQGGAKSGGTFFRYDPATNVYENLYDFGGADGSYAIGQPVFFNGKIYGTCRTGGSGDQGTLYEYNPATNAVVTKVVFDGTRGSHPSCGLIVFNGRLFGVTGSGGANDDGVLYEYLPLPNALVKLADFKADVNGRFPASRLLGYDNKLWGVTHSSSSGFYEGILYQYDLSTGVLSKKKELNVNTGQMAMAGLTLVNNKMYAMTTLGGFDIAGKLFEYDPATDIYTVKTDFEPVQAKWPRHTELAKAPAPAAPGSANSCTNSSAVNVTSSNSHDWIPFTDAQGRAIAEINPNGNVLGNVQARVYINSGPLRQKGSFYYLDRNITITTQQVPTTPVSIRLYISKTEFEKMKNTPGSGITQPEQLSLFRNTDFCASELTANAAKLVTNKSDWGFDYVYSAEVISFGSFYFSTDAAVLPVKMIYFKGAVQPTVNQLEWKSVCTNAVDFIIERSTDGVHFTQVGAVKANSADCNAPFHFNDETPAQLGYYRIKMLEDNNTASYSNVVVLERKTEKFLEVTLMPNPVTGNEARLQIKASHGQHLKVDISDASGRLLLRTTLKVVTGTNIMPVILPVMPAGVYYLRYENEDGRQTIKLLKI